MQHTEDPRINLRIPLELKQKLAHAAIDNGRSMNAEVLSRLEASFAPETTREIENLLKTFTDLDSSRRQEAFELLARAAELLSKP